MKNLVHHIHDCLLVVDEEVRISIFLMLSIYDLSRHWFSLNVASRNSQCVALIHLLNVARRRKLHHYRKIVRNLTVIAAYLWRPYASRRKLASYIDLLMSFTITLAIYLFPGCGGLSRLGHMSSNQSGCKILTYYDYNFSCLTSFSFSKSTPDLPCHDSSFFSPHCHPIIVCTTIIRLYINNL
jgi:hypothetical protein